jgi:hypothetical protein
MNRSEVESLLVQAILEARQPKAMQLEELTDAIPKEWEKQRAILSKEL